MLSDMDAGENFASKTEPTLILDYDRTFADQGLFADGRLDILVSMRMVRDMNIASEENILAYFNAVYGRKGIPDSDPAVVADDYGRVIVLSPETFQWKEIAVLPNIDILPEMQGLRVLEGDMAANADPAFRRTELIGPKEPP